jgi:hypothetical protein
MNPVIHTLLRRSISPSLSLPLLVIATPLCAQKPSGAASLREIAADYAPWQHMVLASLLTGTIALAVIFALHNRKSRKLLDIHRKLNASMGKPNLPRDSKSRELYPPKKKS